jgi:hypothetical protein
MHVQIVRPANPGHCASIDDRKLEVHRECGINAALAGCAAIADSYRTELALQSRP